MTSSLVGSEMCIRDSINLALAPASNATRRQRSTERQEREKKRQRLRKQPVSYTHLTLPTICSV
eukprot:10781150-Prorocentrum_lima.AAC.1